ncbi:hypothetical protein JANAI62_36980 [Jannaschia pagri]|uniref:Haloacid dehalogenase n=1 Tax=Jannaschia pagri TaxID=2829797 RepID=A0ABQ4NRQ3_9RHOB|nr:MULTISPECIES: hypothetical protein [unclassified Jannaschia]GIT93258.1 hypothetical protein JANAI61_37160 [Jannaschia sp. AI_61]GIT97075.1 hypothetical protein JANAI62_36980 [Jannaschia sp. AI_62]
MKALIICSVHALCDISAFERQAFNDACTRHGIPAVLTTEDHAQSIAAISMLDLINHLPGSPKQRRALRDSYLDLLNEAVWGAPIAVRQSVFEALRNPGGMPRPTGFVSDYPQLTTNLVRAAALRTEATRLGKLSPVLAPPASSPVAARLESLAASLGMAHSDIHVLVAHRRDYSAARSLGMQPRLIAELRSSAPPEVIGRTTPDLVRSVSAIAA